MHLAGLSNTPTLSFFGHNLFASSARWATVNDSILQHNFMLNKHYTKKEYLKIENTLLEIIKNG
jgi:ADP-heptose:LPS heptosyltransferase